MKPEVADYQACFVKVGFKFTGGWNSRLTWQGLPYPEALIEFLPEGWGRVQEDVWVTATLLTENPEGVGALKRRFERECVTLSSLEEARDVARDYAYEAREVAAERARLVVGALVSNGKAGVRRIVRIQLDEDGVPVPRPVFLERLSKPFAFCDLALA
jgi:hypothetical protein